jgi:hypothetical protein
MQMAFTYSRCIPLVDETVLIFQDGHFSHPRVWISERSLEFRPVSAEKAVA